MRPPMSSDSEEDDYDGFSFGNEFEKKPPRGNVTSQWMLNHQKENEELNKIVQSIKDSDLQGLKRVLLEKYGAESKINYNDYLKDGWTIMLHAVANLQFEIVSYLIHKGANVNCEADSLTPLMLICKLEAYPSQVEYILSMTKFLLEQGAAINVRDKIGCTPFMFACAKGNKDIVELLFNLSAIDAADNMGNTALHLAVENRHFDIVQMLINGGADIEISNTAGQKPREVATSLALTDIEALFPEEIIDYLPASAEQYQCFKDLAPIFPEHEISPYAQDIPKMLRGMRAESCAKHFVKANTSLAEFLTIDDDTLQSIGIDFEYQRKRILLGLLKYHLHPFSPRSIELVAPKKQKNLYEYFEMYAGYVKHLVMMQAALTYLHDIGGLENVHKGIVNEMLAAVRMIRKDADLLQENIRQATATSTKNPLYIGPATIQSQRHKSVLRPLFKYTIIIGMGIYFGCKLIKLLP